MLPAVTAIAPAVSSSRAATLACSALVDATSALIVVSWSTSRTIVVNESAASVMLSSIRCVLSRIACAELLDSPLAILIPDTIAPIAEPASAADWASELTSWATTPKPRPCSPAWAASIAALIDSSFVRLAIWSIACAKAPTSTTRAPSDSMSSSASVAVRTALAMSSATRAMTSAPSRARAFVAAAIAEDSAA